MTNGITDKKLLMPSIVLALGMVVSTSILSYSMVRFKSLDQTIFVTGSARKRITSDMAIWRVVISREAPQIHDAYEKLAKDIPMVEEYLHKQGIAGNQMVRSSINTLTLREQKQGFPDESGGKVSGYRLSQNIEVRSKDVQKVATVARGATELLKQNIMIDSQNPEYYCTAIGDLKQSMLADAAKDAQLRASKIAESTGSKIGPVRSAKMGALQITQPDSTQVSDQGISDTASIEKDITAVVNVSFSLD